MNNKNYFPLYIITPQEFMQKKNRFLVRVIPVCPNYFDRNEKCSSIITSIHKVLFSKLLICM